MVATLAKSLELVTCRASLGGNDIVDWSSLDRADRAQPFSMLDRSFSARSGRGAQLQLAIPHYVREGITPPFVFETQPRPGVPTNFSPGDAVLFTGFVPGPPPTPGNPGPLCIKFAKPVVALGTQIGADDTYEFIAFLWVYDELDQLLGKFALPSQSSEALDNSAQFIGARSHRANIAAVTLSTSEPERGFGINALSLEGA